VEGVRPSSARVRSAIFDRLQVEVRGARVLDLFAGSGALAIEALSRGAASATLVELQPVLVEFVRAQLAALGMADRAHVVQADARAFVELEAEDSFDLVLVDPPWAQVGIYEPLIEALVRGSWLAPGGVVVVEHERERARTGRAGPSWPATVVVNARREHGSTVLEFLSVPSSSQERPHVP
jgi:16S rRNA (guanine966-N2)-methyltransferase